MVQQEQKPFKPYLIESGRERGNIFRVLEVSGEVTRDQTERLFEQLPINFCLRREDWHLGDESLKEPLEVYVQGPIVAVYPPRRRVLTCTSLASWRSAEAVNKMHVDNIADLYSNYQGQIRSCVHFDPKIFGITDWPNTETIELELDIFVYPKGKEYEPKPKPPKCGKQEVRKLLNLISGGKQCPTPQQVGEWRELILYAVTSMRSIYDSPDIPETDQTRQYYADCWQKIDEAVGDDEKLANALSSLVIAIKWH